MDFDKEKYYYEEQNDMLEVVKNKIKETLYFIENDKCTTWTEYNLRLENLILGVINFYEMYNFAYVKHQHGVNIVRTMVEENFKYDYKIKDISDDK